jgi:hypothetical protein
VPRRRGRARRALVGIPAVFVLAAMVGGAGAITKASAETQPTEATPAPASDFKPTLESPLPPMESPLTFHLSDESAYWYDNGREDLEGFLHTRSLVAGAPGTKVKFEIGEPFTAENHTVSSIIWPTGAKNMPFLQQGSQQGSLEVDLVDPGLYAFQCRVHPYMLGAAVIDDPGTPGADLGKSVHWIDGTDMPTYSDEILRIVRSFFIVTEPANWQVYAPDHDTQWDPSFPAAPVLTYEADGSPHLIPNLDAFYQEMFKEPITLKAPVKPNVKGVGRTCSPSGSRLPSI